MAWTSPQPIQMFLKIRQMQECLEDILDINEMPYNPAVPVVRMDKKYISFWEGRRIHELYVPVMIKRWILNIPEMELAAFWPLLSR